MGAMKKKSDLISSIFWLIFSVFICIESYLLGLGTLHKPGPGFFFFWISVALGLMSTVNLIRAGMIKKTEGKKISIFAGQNILKICSSPDLWVSLCLLYGEAGIYLGYFIALPFSYWSH